MTMSAPRRATPETGSAEVVTVVVRYFAAARGAAGLDEEKIELPTGATVAGAIEIVRALHPGPLARVLDAASFLVNEIAVRDRSRTLGDGARLDILPPFAGG
ncbi:MoaD/ThiS family protein [Amycolatopsis sulphurea]|nr:MoaD/ThiS family protein [Amycolatopsis sulphurea]